MTIDLKSNQIHLFLGVGELQSSQAIQQCLEDVAKALEQKRDLEILTINLFTPDSEEIFLEYTKSGSYLQASFWCSLIANNPTLRECLLFRCYYREEYDHRKNINFSQYEYSDYWKKQITKHIEYYSTGHCKLKPKESIEQSLKDFFINCGLVDKRSGVVSSILDNTTRHSINFFDYMSIKNVFEQDAIAIHAAVFRTRALHSSYFFSQAERTALQNHSTEDIDNAIAKKAFFFLEAEYHQTGDANWCKETDEQWFRLNNFPVPLLLRVFDQAVLHQSPISQYIDPIRPNDAIFDAIKLQLEAGKSCPIQQMYYEHPTKRALDFVFDDLPVLSVLTSGKANLKIFISCMHTRPRDYSYYLKDEILLFADRLARRNKLAKSKPSAITYNIQFQTKFEDRVVPALVQIQSYSAANYRAYNALQLEQRGKALATAFKPPIIDLRDPLKPN